MVKQNVEINFSVENKLNKKCIMCYNNIVSLLERTKDYKAKIQREVDE